MLVADLLKLTNIVFRRSVTEVTNREKIAKIKKLQKQYQCADGQPVWLKTPTDKLLYRATIAGCLVGVGMGLYTLIWEISIKKRFFND